MAETKIKRRYTPQNRAEFKIYNDFMDRYLLDSNILNSGNTPLNVHTILWDKSAILSNLFQLEGNAQGEYIRPDDVKVPASIPNTKRRLKEVEARFVAHCDQREDQGYERPSEWPHALLTERLKLEARLDVYLREAEFLHSKLSEYKTKEISRRNTLMLSYGPLGNGQLRGGVLVEIDYQKVSSVDGVLIITEETSPYRGMKVADYRKYVQEPWRKARETEINTALERRAREYAETGHSKVEVPLGIGQLMPRREDLPPWPRECKNYLSKKIIEK